MQKNFADRLTTRTRQLGHPLCIGLDPYVDRIPSMFRATTEAETVHNFLSAFLDLIADRVAIVKPQISLFERLGIPGFEALKRLIEQAKSLGLLVLLDAKRGDIGETARGYAEAYLCSPGFLEVDAVTVSPYMGLDSVEPFVELAEKNGCGVVVLVRNSNPGSHQFQKLAVGNRQLFEIVAASLKDFEQRLMGTCGWSSLGVTVSANSPLDSIRVREQLPHAFFLVLGFGAQGGTAENSIAGLGRGATGLEGGVISCSRSVLYPNAVDLSWESAVKQGVSRAILQLQSVNADAAGARAT